MANKKLIFVGYNKESGTREIFRPDAEPTTASHGEKFAAVIGPFRTVRGAAWMAHPIRGTMNPHCLCVDDAEYLAKKYKAEYNPKTQSFPDPSFGERLRAA